MKVCSSSGIAGRPRHEAADLVRCFHRSAVRISGGDTLQVSPCGSVDEDVRCLDRCPRSIITRNGSLEERQGLYGALRGESGDRPQLVECQLEVR